MCSYNSYAPPARPPRALHRPDGVHCPPRPPKAISRPKRGVMYTLDEEDEADEHEGKGDHNDHDTHDIHGDHGDHDGNDSNGNNDNHDSHSSSMSAETSSDYVDESLSPSSSYPPTPTSPLEIDIDIPLLSLDCGTPDSRECPLTPPTPPCTSPLRVFKKQPSREPNLPCPVVVVPPRPSRHRPVDPPEEGKRTYAYSFRVLRPAPAPPRAVPSQSPQGPSTQTMASGESPAAKAEIARLKASNEELRLRLEAVNARIALLEPRSEAVKRPSLADEIAAVDDGDVSRSQTESPLSEYEDVHEAVLEVRGHRRRVSFELPNSVPPGAQPTPPASRLSKSENTHQYHYRRASQPSHSSQQRPAQATLTGTTLTPLHTRAPSQGSVPPSPFAPSFRSIGTTGTFGPSTSSYSPPRTAHSSTRTSAAHSPTTTYTPLPPAPSRSRSSSSSRERNFQATGAIPEYDRTMRKDGQKDAQLDTRQLASRLMIDYTAGSARDPYDESAARRM